MADTVEVPRHMTYELFSKYETPEDGFRSPDDTQMAIFSYTIEYVDDDTLETKRDEIFGYSDSHALEEAWYECSSYVYAVTRTQFVYWQ